MKIKDTPLVTQVTKDIKIPCSDGSGQPKSISVEQVKENLIPEAPKDGKEYVRKDGAWVVRTAPEGGYNRKQYEVAGAKWNGSAYILNEVVLTEEQMANTFRWGVIRSNANEQYYGSNIRTNLPSQFSLGSYSTTKPVAEGAFVGCASLEVANLPEAFMAKNIYEIFDGCINLHTINGTIIAQYIKTHNEAKYAFGRCDKLRKVKIQKIGVDISFKDSPLLSVSNDDQSSVGYLLINAVGGSAEKPITATFAKPVYDAIMKSDFLTGKAAEKHIIIAQGV